MLALAPDPTRGRGFRVLFLGAHPDDIEIGCGGTALEFLRRYPETTVTWAVLTGEGGRGDEARKGAELFLPGAIQADVRLPGFRDGFLPWQGLEVKEWFEGLRTEVEPDVIFTHHRDDRHQDHRLVCELTWNTFRSHLILEYEVPKYDGELAQPNFFVPLSEARIREKIRLLAEAFPSQARRSWFEEGTFTGLARLRGVESGSGLPYAEGFHVRKACLEIGSPLPSRVP